MCDCEYMSCKQMCMFVYACRSGKSSWEVLPCFRSSSTDTGSHSELQVLLPPGHLCNDRRKTEPRRRLRGNKIVKMSVLTRTEQDQDKGQVRLSVAWTVGSLTTKFGSQRDTGSNPVSSPTEFHGLVPESSLSLSLAACTVQ